jgi:DNA-binding LacI/PurR family transcriptional regulator
MNIDLVAQHAQVSTATVSRVINGTAVVSPATAERVRESIATLNYYPDVNARALGSGRSGLYGLIISDITNPYFPELVKSFEEIAVEHGQDILIANTNYDPKRMEACVIRMLQRKVDGVAVMTSEMDSHLLKNLSSRKIPLVFMDLAVAMRGVSTVSVDYAAGVRKAMSHLFALGHRRIAFLSGPLKLASACVRSEAFMKCLKEHDAVGEAHLFQEGDHRVEGGRAAMKRVLEGGRHPTAVLASNDLTAIGAMGAIHDAGLRIPEDISIIGFDGIELSAYTQPPLTTLAVSRRELAATAFLSLYRDGKDTVGKRNTRSEHVLEPVLVVRQSTARAPGRRKAR